MRLSEFLKEDGISKALDITEPKMGQKYSDDEVNRNIAQIKKAIKTLRGETDSEAKDAKMSDLLDKQDKWENVDIETTPEEPAAAPEAPADGEGEAPPTDAEKKKEQDKLKRETDAETDREENIQKSLDDREKNKEDVEKKEVDRVNKSIDKSEKKKEDQAKNNEKERETLRKNAEAKKKQKKESRIITTRILL